MKKVLLVVFAMCLFAGASNAQDYKPFKLGIGLRICAMPSDGWWRSSYSLLNPLTDLMTISL